VKPGKMGLLFMSTTCSTSFEKPKGRLVKKARRERARTRVCFMVDSVEGVVGDVVVD